MTVPPRPRDIDILHAEQGAAATEAQLTAEMSRVESVAGELLARLQHVRAAAAGLQLKGAPVETIHKRVHGAQLPKLDVAAPAGDALMARWSAVEARNRSAELIRNLLHGYAAELSRLASQLNADEAELQAAEQAQRAKEREEEIARALPKPPPAPPAAQVPGFVAPKRPQGRREQGRVRMQAAISVESESNFFTGFSTNLSEGGLFVATVNMLPIGSEVDLAFTLPSEKKIQVTGKVRWTREVNDNTPEIFPGLGVQFDDLTDEAARAIHEFVQTREPMFFPD